jgi:hypothetical protein
MEVPIPPATFPVVLSAAAIDRLTALKDAYSADTGATLTLLDWITLHLREVAIGAEWSVAVQSLQSQLQADTNAAVRVEHERLLGLV